MTISFFPLIGTPLKMPYGAFHDSTTQTAANTTTAYPITFNTTDFSNWVYLSTTSRIAVNYPGKYNVQFSVQLQNTTNNAVDIDIWFRKNGTDITVSNSRFGMPARKAVGSPSYIIGSLNIFVDLLAEDYIELVWCTTDVGANIVASAAGTSPTRPSIPSMIATVSFVSSL